MDYIPFEKVSIEEAKAALDGDIAPTPSPSPSKVLDWTQLRSDKFCKYSTGLAQGTKAWFKQLPIEVRPLLLSRQFPRITNRIAEQWKRPLYCEKYLDTLLLDHRGTRKGFPPEVAKEIVTLKLYYLTNVVTQHFGVWGDRIG